MKMKSFSFDCQKFRSELEKVSQRNIQTSLQGNKHGLLEDKNSMLTNEQIEVMLKNLCLRKEHKTTSYLKIYDIEDRIRTPTKDLDDFMTICLLDGGAMVNGKTV